MAQQGTSPKEGFVAHVSSTASVRIRRARTIHRQDDHGDPPRQASQRLRHQFEQGLGIATRSAIIVHRATAGRP